jgi:hypothetical protein
MLGYLRQRLRNYILRCLAEDPDLREENHLTAERAYVEVLEQKPEQEEMYYRGDWWEFGATNLQESRGDVWNWHTIDLEAGDLFLIYDGFIEYTDDYSWDEYNWAPWAWMDAATLDLPQLREFRRSVRYDQDYRVEVEGNHSPRARKTPASDRHVWFYAPRSSYRLNFYYATDREDFVEVFAPYPFWCLWLPRYRWSRWAGYGRYWSLYDDEPIWRAWTRQVRELRLLPPHPVTLRLRSVDRWRRSFAPGPVAAACRYLYRAPVRRHYAYRGAQRLRRIRARGMEYAVRWWWPLPKGGVDDIASLPMFLFKYVIFYRLYMSIVTTRLARVWPRTWEALELLNGYAWRRLHGFRERIVPYETGHVEDNWRFPWNDGLAEGQGSLPRRRWPRRAKDFRGKGFDWEGGLMRSMSWDNLTLWVRWRRIRFLRYVLPMPFYLLYLPLYWFFQEAVKPVLMVLLAPFPAAVLFVLSFLPWFFRTLARYLRIFWRHPLLLPLVPFMAVDIVLDQLWRMVYYPILCVTSLALVAGLLAFLVVWALVPALVLGLALALPLLPVFYALYVRSPWARRMPPQMDPDFSYQQDLEHQEMYWAYLVARAQAEARPLTAEEKSHRPAFDRKAKYPWYLLPWDHPDRPTDPFDWCEDEDGEAWGNRPILCLPMAHLEFFDFAHPSDSAMTDWNFAVLRLYIYGYKVLNAFRHYRRFVYFLVIKRYFRWAALTSTFARWFLHPVYRYLMKAHMVADEPAHDPKSSQAAKDFRLNRRSIYYGRLYFLWYMALLGRLRDWVEFLIVAPLHILVWDYLGGILRFFLEALATLLYIVYNVFWILYKKLVRKPLLWLRLYLTHGPRKRAYRRGPWWLRLVYVFTPLETVLYRIPMAWFFVWWWLHVVAWLGFYVAWCIPHYWVFLGQTVAVWWIIAPVAASLLAWGPILFRARQFYQDEVDDGDRFNVLFFIWAFNYFSFLRFVLRYTAETDLVLRYHKVFVWTWPEPFWIAVWRLELVVLKAWGAASAWALKAGAGLQAWLLAWPAVQYYIQGHQWCVVQLVSLLCQLFPPS